MSNRKRNTTSRKKDENNETIDQIEAVDDHDQMNDDTHGTGTPNNKRRRKGLNTTQKSKSKKSIKSHSLPVNSNKNNNNKQEKLKVEKTLREWLEWLSNQIREVKEDNIKMIKDFGSFVSKDKDSDDDDIKKDDATYNYNWGWEAMNVNVSTASWKRSMYIYKYVRIFSILLYFFKKIY